MPADYCINSPVSGDLSQFRRRIHGYDVKTNATSLDEAIRTFLYAYDVGYVRGAPGHHPPADHLRMKIWIAQHPDGASTDIELEDEFEYYTDTFVEGERLRLYFLQNLLGTEMNESFLCVCSPDRKRLGVNLPWEDVSMHGDAVAMDNRVIWEGCMDYLREMGHIGRRSDREWTTGVVLQQNDVSKEFEDMFGLLVKTLRQITVSDEQQLG